MYTFLNNLSKKRKKILGAAGITAVLGTWVLVPIVAAFYGYSSIDVGLALTTFYCIIWIIHRIYRKYRK